MEKEPRICPDCPLKPVWSPEVQFRFPVTQSTIHSVMSVTVLWACTELPVLCRWGKRNVHGGQSWVDTYTTLHYLLCVSYSVCQSRNLQSDLRWFLSGRAVISWCCFWLIFKAKFPPFCPLCAIYIDCNWTPLCFHSNWCGPPCSTCSSWVWSLWTSLLLLATITKARTIAGTMTSSTWQRWELFVLFFKIFPCFFLEFQMSSLKLATVTQDHMKRINVIVIHAIVNLNGDLRVHCRCQFIIHSPVYNTCVDRSTLGFLFALFILLFYNEHTRTCDTVCECVSWCVWCHQHAGGEAEACALRPHPLPTFLSLTHSWKEEIRKREKPHTQYYLSPLPPPISYTHRSADLFQSVWRLWGEYRKWRRWV